MICNIFNYTVTPDIFLNQTYLVRLGIFHLELGKKHTFWLWEWGRISAPNCGDREPCMDRHSDTSNHYFPAQSSLGVDKIFGDH